MSKKKYKFPKENSNPETKNVEKIENVSQNEEENFDFQPILNHLKKYSTFYLAFFVALLTFIAYTPIFNNEFVNWDDDRYITGNVHLRKPLAESLAFFWGNFYFLMYIPITMSTYAIEYHLVEYKPYLYHFDSFSLHLINTLLVFFFIFSLVKQAKGKYYKEMATIVALLFGIHTFHVESVAWMSERKDVLYSFFFLSSLILYLKFLQKSSSKFLILSLFLFACSALSKGMAVSLSLSVLAIDYFLERDLWSKKVLLEKLPYFLLSIFFGILAILAVGTDEPFADKKDPSENVEKVGRPLYENALYASYGFLMYILKLIYPFHLSAIYPYPEKFNGEIPLEFWFYPIAVLIVVALFFYGFKRWKHLTFSIAFFSFNLIFVLQLFSYQSFIMTDRYSYIASIGFFFLMSFGYAKLVDFKPLTKPYLNVGLGIYVLMLIFLTRDRVDVWQNSATLWSDVNEKYPKVIVAYYNKGNYFQELEKFDEAIKDYSEAILLNPNHIGAISNRGITKAKKGDAEGALQDFNKVVKIDSNYSNIYSNRGNAKMMLGDINGAIKDYTRAINDDSLYIDAIYNRANARSNPMVADYKGAVEDYNRLLRLAPNNSYAFSSRGFAKMNLNDFEGAMKDYETALSLDKKNTFVYLNRGLLKELMGKQKEAEEDFAIFLKLNPQYLTSLLQNAIAYERANQWQNALNSYNQILKFEPKNIESLLARGVLYGRLGKLNFAMQDFNKVLEIDSKNAAAYSNRGFAKAIGNDVKGAISDYEQAIRLDPNSATAYYNRGLMRQKVNDFQGALSDFDATIKYSPTFGDAYYNRAILLVRLNRKNDACNDFEKALQLGIKAAEQQLKTICGK